MRLLFCVLLLTTGFNASAERIIRNATILTMGTQDGVDGTEPDTFWIALDKSIEATSCHTSALNRVVFDLSKDVSKSAMSMALTAYSTGKTIDIDTYATCVQGWSEVRNLYFSPGRECKKNCVSGILNLLKGMQNANIRQTYRSAS